ncbi:MAG: hypothetical protein ABEI99_05155 [Halobaculum sp.]
MSDRSETAAADGGETATATGDGTATDDTGTATDDAADTAVTDSDDTATTADSTDTATAPTADRESVPSGASFPVTESVRARFRETFRANADDLARFQRRRRRLESIDRASPVVLLAAGLSLALSFLLVGSGYARLYFGVDLLALGFGVLFGALALVRFLYAAALYRSPLDAERVAGHEIAAAMTAFGDGTTFDTEEILDRLRTGSEFLGYAGHNELLAPRHADALVSYVTQIDAANDPETALRETFPEVGGIAAAAFAAPTTPRIDERAVAVETASETERSARLLDGVGRDARLLLDYLLARPVGIVSTAVALGAVTALLFGLWRGATVGVTVVAVYGGVRGLLRL